MQNQREFYILGLPIQFPNVGNVHFIKVKELPEFLLYQNILMINKDKLLSTYQQANLTKDELNILKNELTLYDWIMNISEFRQLYSDLFDFVFKEKNIIKKVNRDNFDSLRQLIMDMNCLKEEKINPNPEIQAWIEKSKKAKSNGEKVDFQDMISSVAVGMGLSYSEINEMTLYQFCVSFSRISAFKSYDTSCLFSAVSSEKINIESWCKNIDLFKEESNGISRDEFNRLKGSVFGGGR